MTTVSRRRVLAGPDRESRSPAATGTVRDAFEARFRTEGGTWSFPSSGEDLRTFHRIPAMAARLYPKLPPTERVDRAVEVLAGVEADERRWRWLVGRVAADGDERTDRAP